MSLKMKKHTQKQEKEANVHNTRYHAHNLGPKAISNLAHISILQLQICHYLSIE